MTDEKLIDPQWLIQARRNRHRFVLRVGVVFAILSVVAWWALPNFAGKANEAARAVGRGPLPGHLATLLWLAGGFKALWVAIALGCGAGLLLALSGKLDSLLPVLNVVVLVIGLAAVALTFYVFYAPALILIQGAR